MGEGHIGAPKYRARATEIRGNGLRNAGLWRAGIQGHGLGNLHRSKMATLPKQPAQATAAAKREAKRQATKVIKRRKTLIGKSHGFHKDCGFEVLLLLQKGRRSYAYTSPGMPFWPPIAE
ncbi:hypothetical protein F5Y09DRAFT_343797 [Xylaria sp. FL1042]|nr:hypothetical protein F5Y09DRAFT_343797 [Xylaria sp. FL1042]